MPVRSDCRAPTALEDSYAREGAKHLPRAHRDHARQDLELRGASGCRLLAALGGVIATDPDQTQTRAQRGTEPQQL
jgi:hypothetical protein